MADKVRAGEIDFVSGGRALTLKVPVKSTLGALHFLLTGDLVETAGGGTLLEDSVYRLIKRLEVSVGGLKIKTLGDGAAYSGAGVQAYYYNQILWNTLPELSEPAVTVGTNAFRAAFSVPFEMPPALANQYPQQNVQSGGKTFSINARKLTMLSPTGKDIEIDVDWGVVGDVISGGTNSLDSVKLEVIAEIYPELDGIQMPLLLHETTKQADFTAGANTREETQLDRFGIVPFINMITWDNGVKDDAVMNRAQYVINGVNYKIDSSWNALKADTKRAAGLQAAALPTGVAMAIFDSEEDGSGALILDASDVKRFSLFSDHDALTGVFKQTLHQFQIKKQG